MADKKNIHDRAKSLWIRGMKAIGNTAASIANNTRYKVDEVTIQNRRREVMNDLANKVYALWLKGIDFPEQLTRMLSELKHLDEQLNDMRAEKYASSGKVLQAETAETKSNDEDIGNDTEEDEEEKPASDPSDDSFVSLEINGLFDGASSVGATAEKVNLTLEQMSDRIRSFPKKSSENETEKRKE